MPQTSTVKKSAAIGPLPRDEFAMPGHDRVRRDQRGDLGQRFVAEDLALGSESAALGIRQAESLATELLLQDAVLLSEVLDDCVLMAADPAGEGGHEDLPGLEDGGHPSIVPRQRNIRQLSLAAQVGLFFPGIGSVE